jgi:dTDP-4-dehydrorhamnose 3,5-epimerase
VRFERTGFEGLIIVTSERHEDQRGSFSRAFCESEFSEFGSPFKVSQASIATNVKRGVLRGLHYQRSPHGERKIVRVTRGAVWDVLVDLRRDSATYKKWFGMELTAESGRSLCIPKQMAHGYLTLTDNSELLYLMDYSFVPEAATGVRWDDTAFHIEWPSVPQIISERDRGWPDFE